ncbi:hypothetical protein ACIBH1_35985 [Nonomuraea sp. NPDC050663]|uniref:hypothetical protein n=1 Tax=Nonomuraea sp. NPDC050663 TaxID=3364370 RepID=UPI0037B5FD37
MSDFIDATLAFPAVIFTFLLVVVIGYWIVVVTGLTHLDEDLAWLGLSGVPAGVTLSLLIALAWFFSLAGGTFVDSTPLRVGVLVLAVAASWFVTKLLVKPLRRLAPAASPSRHDFVGMPCVVRTGLAGNSFGQAEVTAADGSTAVVQVRTTGADVLKRGDKALIFDYDAGGEFYYVMPDERVS